MAGTLEDYFVKIGVKGQNVVLSNIAKVKKEAKALSDLKPTLNMGKNLIAKMAGIARSGGTVPESPEQKKEDKARKESSGQFMRGAKQFGNATKDFASSASTFDPTTVFKAATSSLGTALSGVTIMGQSLGQLPKGIADITNSLVDMASGALKIAKESAAGAYGLSRRDTATSFYGGGDLSKGRMSNQEHAELVSAISGSYGKIQKPMLNALNELAGNMDTAALSRVASGNWASTGTDKGWVLQQISNQTQGLPPSIAQAIQTSLLKSNSDLIQSNEGQQGQDINAGYERQSERQTAKLFRVTSAEYEKFTSMNADLNAMQVELVNAGVKFAGAIASATSTLRGLPDTINNIQKKIDYMMNKIPEFMRPSMMRIGK